MLYNTLKMDQICNCSFYWFDLWIKYSQESFTKKTLTPTEHHNIYLMDLSDVLYTSVLPYGFIRYFSDNRHGSLFQPLTPIITPSRTEFFFKAIWWIQPLSETEWSEGVLKFCNSVCLLTGQFPPLTYTSWKCLPFVAFLLVVEAGGLCTVRRVVFMYWYWFSHVLCILAILVRTSWVLLTMGL